jgi:uncharacterized protein YbaP (TraB family)
MKKIFLFIIFFCTFSFNIFSQKNESNQLLWKIYKKGSSKVSYLYGTIHIRDKRVFNFSDSVIIGINSCDLMANEFNMEQGFKEILNLLNSSDTTGLLSQQMKKEEYDQLKENISSKTGMSIDKLNAKDSWILKVFTSRGNWSEDENNSKQTFVDAYLAALAKKAGKKIAGLEEMKDYQTAYAGYLPNGSETFNSDYDPTEVITGEKKQVISQKSMQEKFIKTYESGNVEAIYHLFADNASESENKALRIRNANMVIRMDSIMKNSTLFAAVGSAHLAGDSGMVSLLRKKGYIVEAVKPVYTGLASKYNYDQVEYTWTQFLNEEKSFSLETPMEMIKIPLKQKSYDFDMNIAFDLYTYSYFITINLRAGVNITRSNEERSFKAMVSNTFTKDKYLLLSEKYYPDAEPSRYEVFAKKGNSYERVNYSNNDGEIVITMVGGNKKTVYGSNADRFVKSILFHKSSTPVISGFKLHTDIDGAYEALMPLSSKNFDQNVKDADGTNIEIKMRYNSIPENESIFMSAYYIMDGNQIVNEDSIFLDYMRNSLGSSNKNLLLSDVEYSTFDEKYTQLNCLVKNSATGNKQKIKLIIRDNRAYLFLTDGTEAASKSEAVSAFFNSIKFLPYKETELTKFYPADSTFFVRMPAKQPTIDSTKADYQLKYVGYKDYLSYGFYDKNSSLIYVVTAYEYSPYLNIYNRKKFIDSVQKDVIDSAKIISDRYLFENGRHIKDVIYQKGKNKPERLKLILSGQRLFEITATMTVGMLQSKQTDEIFNSLNVTSSAQTENYEPLKKLFQDLNSSDSLTASNAYDALDFLQAEEKDKTLLRSAMANTYIYDTSYNKNYHVKRSLLERLIEINYPGHLQMIEDYYKEAASSTDKMDVLKSLIGYNADSIHIHLASEFLKSNPPVVDSITLHPFLYNPYNCTTNKEMLSTMTILLKNERYQEYAFCQIMEIAVFDSTMTSETFLPVQKQMQDIFESRIEALTLNKESLWEGQAEIICEGVYKLGMPDAENILRKYLIQPEAEYRYYATIALLNMKKEVSKEVIAELAKNTYFRKSLHEKLTSVSRLDLFPKEYSTQKKIAESDLYVYLVGEYGTPVEMIYISEQIMTIHDTKGRLYLFKFKLEGDEEWYAGISAFHNEDKKIIDHYFDYTSTHLTKFKAKSSKDHINELTRYLFINQ